MRIDRLFLLPPPMMMDIRSSILESTRMMDHPPTMPLRKKTYQSMMSLSITMILSLTTPPEPLIFAPSSSPNTSKASGITAFEKPQPLILSLTSSARTPTILLGCLLTDFFLKDVEVDSRDCPYVPYEATNEGTNIGSEMNSNHP